MKNVKSTDCQTFQPVRVVIAPGTVCSNKGDQALVAMAIEQARRLWPHCEIGMPSTARDMGHDPELRQIAVSNIRPIRKVLPSPRRAFLRHLGPFDSVCTKVVLRLIGVLDLSRSLIALAVAPCKHLSRFLLGAEISQSLQFYRESKCIFLKGGGMIYSYRSLKWLYYLYFALYPLLLGLRLNVPVIVLPNSFGPFANPLSDFITREVLDRCHIVAAREAISYRELKRIGVNPRVFRHVPDMAFALPRASDQRAWQLLEKAGVRRQGAPMVGLTLRPWRFPTAKDPARAWDNYLSAMTELVKHVLRRGLRPVFFPQSIGPHDHEDDRIAIKQILGRLDPRTYDFVDGDFHPSELKAMYSQMSYFIGTRMHSVIFAISTGVPSIAVSYQGPKAPGTMEDMGLQQFVLLAEHITDKRLIEKFDLLVSEREEVVKRLNAKMPAVLAKLDAWEQEIRQVLDIK